MTHPAKTYRYDAFLSYRHAEPDRAFACDLHARLTAAGLRVAIDEVDSKGGEWVYLEMARCVRESRFTLAVISPQYLKSAYTRHEALYSSTVGLDEDRRRLIPLTLERVEPARMPDWLHGLVEIDFTEPRLFSNQFKRLLSRLQDRETEPVTSGEPTQLESVDPRRELTHALDAAYLRQEELLTQGGDVSAVKAEILDLRRKIREGGRLHPGDFLAEGRFKLIEPLGRGGFATVWKAFDRRERTPVAIKVLHGQFVDDRTRLERFFRGARKMAELGHPGIVRVTEKRLDDGGFHFFVMEYLEGGDLRQAVLGGKVPPENVVPLIQEVAEALQYAHDRGVFHRDVKPANLLLDRQGRPKLTDFDLVGAIDTTGGTLEGAMLGTLLYSAPEALSDAQAAKAPADVYSLAVTTAFCLYCRDLPPAVLRELETFLRALPCSRAVAEVLIRATVWEADKRIATVREFSQELGWAEAAPPDPALWGNERHYSRRPMPSLEVLLEEALGRKEPEERSQAVFQIVEESLPINREEVRKLGLVSWALDYGPGRDLSARARDAAHGLRRRLWAPVHLVAPRPTVAARDRRWVSIAGGRFKMGGTSGGYRSEQPLHEVSLSSFRMLAHPVTNREFRVFDPERPGDNNLPVVEVDWYTAYAYAAWLGGRLATEAEWEYAARAGSAHDYADRFGARTSLERVAWYAGNSGGQLHEVEKLEMNPWRLFDMIGNVWEWVADWYAPYFTDTQADPWGPHTGSWRVVRGGSFAFDAGWARSACRSFGAPGISIRDLGFRVVLPSVHEVNS